MADKKISQLTALSAANLAPSTDVLAIVDTSATETKKIVAQDLINGVLNVASAVGIGTASPAQKLDVTGGARFYSAGNWMQFGVNALESLNNDGGYIRAVISTASNPTYSWQGDQNTGIFTPAADTIGVTTGGTERMRLDSSGNLGLGVTPSAWSGYTALQIGGTSGGFIANAGNNMALGSNAYNDGAWKYVGSNFASSYVQSSGQHIWFTAPSGTAGNTISFTQAMTLDASGNLGIGGAAPSGVRLLVESGDTQVSIKDNNTNKNSSPSTYINFVAADARAGYFGYPGSNDLYINNESSGGIFFSTNATERGRFTAGGDLLIGKTGTNLASAGVELRGGNTDSYFTVTDAASVMAVNRESTDGDLIRFFQGSASQEGSISVSGATVSYNAFAGSHWAQLQDGSKPGILRGTVMESINELCVWPGEDNERLPKAKISDTAGSKKVYGVFMTWEPNWDTTNDMLITSVGAFICRVNGSVTVQEGDLLESNGDGTARVQSDDIIRSSTIGKVTSTVKTHQYDDGSYCVPTVLYCG